MGYTIHVAHYHNVTANESGAPKYFLSTVDKSNFQRGKGINAIGMFGM